MSEWPKHPDGRNKKIGEMTREEADAVTRAAVEHVAKEFGAIGVKVRYGGYITAEQAALLTQKTKGSA